MENKSYLAGRGRQDRKEKKKKRKKRKEEERKKGKEKREQGGPTSRRTCGALARDQHHLSILPLVLFLSPLRLPFCLRLFPPARRPRNSRAYHAAAANEREALSAQIGRFRRRPSLARRPPSAATRGRAFLEGLETCHVAVVLRRLQPGHAIPLLLPPAHARSSRLRYRTHAESGSLLPGVYRHAARRHTYPPTPTYRSTNLTTSGGMTVHFPNAKVPPNPTACTVGPNRYRPPASRDHPRNHNPNHFRTLARSLRLRRVSPDNTQATSWVVIIE